MLSAYINVRHIIVLEVFQSHELLERMQRRARLEGRMDDVREEIIKKRLEVYQEQIHKILEYYPKHLISYVNGGQRPLEVLRDVLVRLSHLLSRHPPYLTN